MAGHRRKTGAPLRSRSRAERRRELLRQRLAAATSPAGRLGAACDYARGVLAELDPARADRVARELVDHLIGVVDQARRER